LKKDENYHNLKVMGTEEKNKLSVENTLHETITFLFEAHILERAPTPVRICAENAKKLATEYVSLNKETLYLNFAKFSTVEEFIDSEEPQFWSWVSQKLPEMSKNPNPLYL
jgi:hypothetical protein